MRLHRLLPAFILSASLLTTGFLPSTAKAESVETLKKIAVVDVMRCILETADGKRRKKKLEKEFARGNKKLERKAAKLKKEYEELAAKAPMLAPEELNRRQQSFMRKQSELEQLFQELQASIQEKEAELANAMFENVAAITKKMAKAEGIQIVLTKTPNTVIYANPKLDLTNKVIVAYDKKYK